MIGALYFMFPLLQSVPAFVLNVYMKLQGAREKNIKRERERGGEGGGRGEIKRNI